MDAGWAGAAESDLCREPAVLGVVGGEAGGGGGVCAGAAVDAGGVADARGERPGVAGAVCGGDVRAGRGVPQRDGMALADRAVLGGGVEVWGVLGEREEGSAL